MRLSGRILAIAALLSWLSGRAPDALAFRNIYYGEDPCFTWGMGHYLQNPEPGDMFFPERLYTFEEVWEFFVHPEELIILVHGEKGRIWLNGQEYGGFRPIGSEGGTGIPACDPYDLLYQPVEGGMTLTFLSCNAGRDPDGAAGRQVSVVESIRPCLPPDAVVTGHTRTVALSYCFDLQNGTNPQITATMACLAAEARLQGHHHANDDSVIARWFDTLDYWEQTQNVQPVIDACSGAGGVRIVFTYPLPEYERGGGFPELPPGYRHGLRDDPPNGFCRRRAPCEWECGEPTASTETTWGGMKGTYR
jgi:hypothetical protein